MDNKQPFIALTYNSLKELELPLAALLCAINSLCAKEGYCWASNKSLANLFKTSERTISRQIMKLKQQGYISIKTENGKRYIYITNFPNDTNNDLPF